MHNELNRTRHVHKLCQMSCLGLSFHRHFHAETSSFHEPDRGCTAETRTVDRCLTGRSLLGVLLLFLVLQMTAAGQNGSGDEVKGNVLLLVLVLIVLPQR